MSEFVIGESLYVEGKLVEVTICCLDHPEPPYYHLDQPHYTDPADVVNIIKGGHKVIAAWGPKGGIPVEVVTLADGTESIEVVQQGQPEGNRSLADLPKIEA